MKEDKSESTTIFAVRTTIGREKSVQKQIFKRLLIAKPFPNLKSILTAKQLRGYVFVEAPFKKDVMIGR